VLKDLIVDMDPFMDDFKSVLPYLINDSGEPDKERRQSPEDRARYDDTTKCILCACCTTSCPVFWGDGATSDRRPSSTPPLHLRLAR
jgi:succinate dehydrogenase / fumarate reductase iron-sulfur subunit